MTNSRYLNALIELCSSVRNGHFAIFRDQCAYCDRNTIFLRYGTHPRQARCTRCRNTYISLAALSVVKELPLDSSESVVYELSYHGALFNYLSTNFRCFYFSEFFQGRVDRHVDGIRNEDVQHLSFGDNTFDLVTATEVFEHVPDYMLGFAEVCRVLKKDGAFIFTVPLFEHEVTEHVCALADYGSLMWLAEPEYHDSRVTGPHSVPVFWRHSSRQIADDLLRTGFKTACLIERSLGGGRVSQTVLRCTK